MKSYKSFSHLKTSKYYYRIVENIVTDDKCIVEYTQKDAPSLYLNITPMPSVIVSRKRQMEDDIQDLILVDYPLKAA